MDWITASLWLCVIGIFFILGINFLRQSRELEEGSVGRSTRIVLFIMFMILGGTKLFDLLVVNLGAAPEPIPFLYVVAPQNLYFGLLVMSLYIIGFSFLLFVLERYTINTKYVLTLIPVLIIIIAWILMISGIPVNLFLEDLYESGSESWILLFFYIPRSFIPFAYLYLAIKTSGIYRKKSLALFFGYGGIVTFFVRQPRFEFLAPYMILGFLLFVIWGHKEA